MDAVHDEVIHDPKLGLARGCEKRIIGGCFEVLTFNELYNSLKDSDFLTGMCRH